MNPATVSYLLNIASIGGIIAYGIYSFLSKKDKSSQQIQEEDDKLREKTVKTYQELNEAQAKSIEKLEKDVKDLNAKLADALERIDIVEAENKKLLPYADIAKVIAGQFEKLEGKLGIEREAYYARFGSIDSKLDIIISNKSNHDTGH